MQKLKQICGKKSLLLGAAAVAALIFPLCMQSYNYGIMIACFIFLYVIAVSGLDILFGYSGQISMGHAGFFAIGAYGSAMLNHYLGIPVLAAMIIAAAVAAVIGVLLAMPASKLVFHFLSLATIAFGEIIYQLIAQSPNEITGNFTGFFCEPVSIFGFAFNTNTRFYYFALICVAVFLYAKMNLANSRVGRAMLAIRENSHAANGMGVNVRKYKVMAFSLSAVFTAFAGSMYAHLVGFISPDTFTRKQSVMFMTMLLFGGTASALGPVCGVVAVVLLNECLRSAEKYQMLIYGILLLLVIVLIPGGLYGTIKDAILQRKGGKKNAKS